MEPIKDDSETAQVASKEQTTSEQPDTDTVAAGEIDKEIQSRIKVDDEVHSVINIDNEVPTVINEDVSTEINVDDEVHTRMSVDDEVHIEVDEGIVDVHTSGDDNLEGTQGTVAARDVDVIGESVQDESQGDTRSPSCITDDERVQDGATMVRDVSGDLNNVTEKLKEKEGVDESIKEGTAHQETEQSLENLSQEEWNIIGTQDSAEASEITNDVVKSHEDISSLPQTEPEAPRQAVAAQNITQERNLYGQIHNIFGKQQGKHCLGLTILNSIRQLNNTRLGFVLCCLTWCLTVKHIFFNTKPQLEREMP